MATPVLYGPAYSTYARTARLALEEKGVAYKLVEVDMLKGETQAPEYLARQPFAKVPSFEHDGFAVYETRAIERYVDEAFAGPKLQPSDAKARARMDQIIGIVDSYAYPAFIGKVVMQRLIAPLMGGAPDEKMIADATAMVDKCADALEALAGGGDFLVGSSLSLADLHLAPVMAYFSATPEGEKVLAKSPKLARWWKSLSQRASMTKTAPKLG